MLRINNNEYKVLTSDLKYVDATYNSKKGYSILVSLDIELNKVKGYISFYVDFFKDKDFKNIKNRKYIELPTELNSKITMIEIFDTANFIDFIDSEVNAEKENITEELKSSNKMLWIGKMNNIKNMVEEIVLKEYIYV